MHGQFVWYELTTPDVDAAQKFYPRFTGWGTQKFDENYTMWTTGGAPFAGVFRLTDQMRQQGVPPNWMPYVETSNVDDTAKKALSLGGKVTVPAEDIPGTGRFAVLQDPQGATFGIYKSANPGGAWDGKAVVGRFSWHELMTSDYLKAFEFYKSLFGWEKLGEMDMGGGSMYLLFGKGENQYGGMFNRTPDMATMPPFWLIYIHVKDVGKAVESATKAGAFVQRERMEIPGGGTIAILGDPQGAGFALHDTKSLAPVSPAATVAKAGDALKKAASSAANAVTKAVKKVRKAAAKTKKATMKAAKKTSRRVAKKAMPKTARKPARGKAKSRPKTAARKATPRKKARAGGRKSVARKTASRRKSPAKKR